MTHISDAFDMTAATLWVVWTHTSPVALAQGRAIDKVTCFWILASEGEQGLAEIQGPRGIPKRFIAAAPLTALREITQSTTRAQHGAHLPRWLKGVIPGFDSVRLVRLPDGQMEWLVSGEKTPASSITLCEGKRSDLVDLLNEGEKILNTKNYKEVLGDARALSEGHPSDWIMYKRNPSGMARIDAWMAKQEDEKSNP